MGADDLVRYYSDRAREYERIYSKPERQDDLCTLERLILSLLDGSRLSNAARRASHFA